MQELEKILEEIDIKIAGSMGKKREGLLEAREIIRKHMNEKVTANDLISRQTLLDDFRNTITENSDTFDWLNMIARQPVVDKDDGWIPVEDERLWDILFEEACVEGGQARRIYNRLKETFDGERSEMNEEL